MIALAELAEAAVKGLIAGVGATIHDEERAVSEALAAMQKIDNPEAFGDFADARERAKQRLAKEKNLETDVSSPPMTLSDEDVEDDVDSVGPTR